MLFLIKKITVAIMRRIISKTVQRFEGLCMESYIIALVYRSPWAVRVFPLVLGIQRRDVQPV